jgi:hypothetical protein
VHNPDHGIHHPSLQSSRKGGESGCRQADYIVAQREIYGTLFGELKASLARQPFSAVNAPLGQAVKWFWAYRQAVIDRFGIRVMKSLVLV